MARPDDIKIAIIGLGRMGNALLKGLKRIGFESKDIIFSNKSENNSRAVEKADWIFLAVKPGKVSEALEEVPAQSRQKILVSLVAGVKLQKLKRLAKGKNIEVIRIMPSLAIQTGNGVIGVYKRKSPWIPDQVRDDKVLLLKEKLSLLGEVVEVQNEKDLDILTIISGCSPAILAYFAQAFAVFSGKSEKLVLKSFLSSLKYIEKSGNSFEEIIKAVATRGGITENILDYLNSHKVKENVESALESGYTKLRNLKA